MKQTRFQIAKKDIISYFDHLPSSIVSYLALSEILAENSTFWRLPIRLTTRKFTELLIHDTKLKRYDIKFPHRKIIRFVWRKASPFQLALSLKGNSYFTHYTALFLHGFTDQIPKTLYLNSEQIKKIPNKSELVQKNIDFAFSGKQRISKNIALWGNYKICLLNGKYTDQLGVIKLETREKEEVLVTDVERTLIDATVRPAYSGGVYEVLNAFKQAKSIVSVNKLTAMLKNLDYKYPYHQAIGFYLEKSGNYKESQIDLLRQFPIKFDFYLTHGIKEKQYSPKWKIHYPKGF